MKVFVSYTLRDKFLSLNDLYDLEYMLKLMGDPYIDILHNRSSNPQEYIMKRLSSANLLLACVTPGYFNSEWARLEIITAKSLNIPQAYIKHSDLEELLMASRQKSDQYQRKLLTALLSRAVTTITMPILRAFDDA